MYDILYENRSPNHASVLYDRRTSYCSDVTRTAYKTGVPASPRLSQAASAVLVRDNWMLPQTAPTGWPYEMNSLAYPYNMLSPVAVSADNQPTRVKNGPRESTSALKSWLYEHLKNPYPSKCEKIMMAIATKMTLTQVSTWFANARRRLKKDTRVRWVPRDEDDDDLDGCSDVIDDVTDIDSSNSSTMQSARARLSASVPSCDNRLENNTPVAAEPADVSVDYNDVTVSSDVSDIEDVSLHTARCRPSSSDAAEVRDTATISPARRHCVSSEGDDIQHNNRQCDVRDTQTSSSRTKSVQYRNIGRNTSTNIAQLMNICTSDVANIPRAASPTTSSVPCPRTAAEVTTRQTSRVQVAEAGSVAAAVQRSCADNTDSTDRTKLKIWSLAELATKPTTEDSASAAAATAATVSRRTTSLDASSIVAPVYEIAGSPAAGLAEYYQHCQQQWFRYHFPSESVNLAAPTAEFFLEQQSRYPSDQYLSHLTAWSHGRVMRHQYL